MSFPLSFPSSPLATLFPILVSVLWCVYSFSTWVIKCIFMVTYGHHGTDQCRDNITRHHAYLLQYHIAYFFFHVGLGPTCHLGLGHVGTWSQDPRGKRSKWYGTEVLILKIANTYRDVPGWEKNSLRIWYHSLDQIIWSKLWYQIIWSKLWCHVLREKVSSRVTISSNLGYPLC